MLDLLGGDKQIDLLPYHPVVFNGVAVFLDEIRYYVVFYVIFVLA